MDKTLLFLLILADRRIILPFFHYPYTTFFNVPRCMAIYSNCLVIRIRKIIRCSKCNLIKQNDSVPMTIIQNPCNCITVMGFEYNDKVGLHKSVSSHRSGSSNHFISHSLCHIYHDSITWILSPIKSSDTSIFSIEESFNNFLPHNGFCKR